MRIQAVLVGMLAILLAISVAGCGAEPAAEAPAPEAPASEEQAQESPAAAAPVPMGQPGTSGDWTVTVKETEREASTGGAQATEGNELFVIKFDLTNGGTTDQGTGPVYFVLEDASKTAFEAAPTSDDKFIFNTPQPIKAGETREIRIAYQVPTGSGPFTWTFTPFVEGGATPAVFEVK